jgi:hypothetical protein
MVRSVPGFSSIYIFPRLAAGMYETGGCAGNPIESFFRWATENNTTPGLVQEQDYPYNPKEYRIIGPFKTNISLKNKITYT